MFTILLIVSIFTTDANIETIEVIEDEKDEFAKQNN